MLGDAGVRIREQRCGQRMSALKRPSLVAEGVARRWHRLAVAGALRRKRRRAAAPAWPVDGPRALRPCCIWDRPSFRKPASPLRRPGARRWYHPRPATRRPCALAGAPAIRADRSGHPAQPAPRAASPHRARDAPRQDGLPARPARLPATPAAPALPGRRPVATISCAGSPDRHGLRVAGPWRSSRVSGIRSASAPRSRRGPSPCAALPGPERPWPGRRARRSAKLPSPAAKGGAELPLPLPEACAPLALLAPTPPRSAPAWPKRGPAPASSVASLGIGSVCRRWPAGRRFGPKPILRPPPRVDQKPRVDGQAPIVHAAAASVIMALHHIALPHQRLGLRIVPHQLL